MIKRSPGDKRHSSDPAAPDATASPAADPIVTAAPAAPQPGADKGDVPAPEVGDRIGRELRAMFADVVAEPVPDKIRALLEELERQSRKPER
jgi:hypothetical protein